MTATPVFEESEWSSETGRGIRDAVRALTPLVREHASQSEKQGFVAEPVMQELARTGLFRISVPREYGGYALGARDVAEILTATASTDGAVAWVTMIASGFARVAMCLPKETVKEIYTDRCEDWPGPIVASASLFSEKIQLGRKVRDGYIVNSGGKWGFGSGCKHAHFMGVGIEFEDEAGDKYRGMALLEKGQYRIVDDWNVMGLCASSSNSISTGEDVFVPAHRFMNMAEFPQRLDLIRTQYAGKGYMLNGLGLMLYVALETMCIVLGMAIGTLGCFVEQVRDRKPFNLPYKTLGEAPAMQLVAAKARATISAAQALLFSRADQLDRMASIGVMVTPAVEGEFMMDFAYAGTLAAQAIDMLQLAVGSSTISVKNPIQRFARDARVALTHGSTRLDPLAEINGREILAQPPFSGFSGAIPGVPDQSGKTASGKELKIKDQSVSDAKR
jgi:alkylation response protein AidB-like acyl-CoA dehydrogenase